MMESNFKEKVAALLKSYLAEESNADYLAWKIAQIAEEECKCTTE